ncbi:MAG: teichoic acid D-Ala incorporation-associated protein DltX [Kurthia sp.]|nr:teichoic acid D-Ala incorporation-associated protein DltX [Candidatus Kurthia equi]
MSKLHAKAFVYHFGNTLFYFSILVLLVLIYGFHDMSAGPFIYTEF